MLINFYILTIIEQRKSIITVLGEKTNHLIMINQPRTYK
jgi:hypothetical protein